MRFVAQDIPALGYKVYVLRKAGQAEAAAAASVQQRQPGERLLSCRTGSRHRGSAQHLRQATAARTRQHPKPLPVRTNISMFPAATSSRTRCCSFPWLPPRPNCRSITAHGWPFDLDQPNSRRLALRAWKARARTRLRLPREIRLFDHEKKIEFTEDVDKKEIDDKEAVYFAFPFAMQQPQFQYEIQNGVVDPSKDMYAGAGHEWFSVQHWISAQQDGLSATVMPLDAPLVTLGDINRGDWPAEFGKRTGTIFSYVMNNYWFTNYRAGQGGHFRFRYVVTSAPSTDPVQLSRMGWEEMTPFETDEVTSQDKALNQPRPLDGKQGSFLDVQDPNLLLETWKTGRGRKRDDFAFP